MPRLSECTYEELTKQAKVVRDFAQTAISRFDESLCPFWNNSNYKIELGMWLEKNEKAKKEYLERKASKPHQD